MELSVHNKVSHVTVAIESVCIRTPRRMTKVGLLLLCAVFGCAFAATPTEKCTDFSGGNIKFGSVDVPGCTAAPCILKRGTNKTVTVTFTPTIVETDVTNKVYGIIKGIPVPFPLSEPDACKLGATCPMPANKMETEHVVIEILKLFPPLELIVKWELLGQDGKEQTCFLLEVKIV